MSKMTKKEVQKRILQNGKPLALNKFNWDGNTKTFSTKENNLVIDFSYINSCTFITGWDCTFTTGWGCTFTTGSGCTFITGWDCTFTTGSDCTFKTGPNCTFTTGSGCTFKTGSGCTFKTGSGCTFKTCSGCTFTTGWYCVAVRRDVFEIIEMSPEQTLTICPRNIKGFVSNGVYSETNKPAIIADGILSEIISKKTTNGLEIYKVINHGDKKHSYLIKSDGVFSHGKSLKEARESFKYKTGNRDLTKYKDLKMESVLSDTEAIRLYREITGACESGTRYFVENLENPPKKLTLRELIKLTEGQYNHCLLVDFFQTEI